MEDNKSQKPIKYKILDNEKIIQKIWDIKPSDIDETDVESRIKYIDKIEKTIDFIEEEISKIVDNQYAGDQIKDEQQNNKAQTEKSEIAGAPDEELKNTEIKSEKTETIEGLDEKNEKAEIQDEGTQTFKIPDEELKNAETKSEKTETIEVLDEKNEKAKTQDEETQTSKIPDEELKNAETKSEKTETIEVLDEKIEKAETKNEKSQFDEAKYVNKETYKQNEQNSNYEIDETKKFEKNNIKSDILAEVEAIKRNLEEKRNLLDKTNFEKGTCEKEFKNTFTDLYPNLIKEIEEDKSKKDGLEDVKKSAISERQIISAFEKIMKHE